MAYLAYEAVVLYTPSALQTTISQLIVAVRTIAVSRQTRWVTWTIAIMFPITVAVSALLENALLHKPELVYTFSLNSSPAFGVGSRSGTQQGPNSFVLPIACPVQKFEETHLSQANCTSGNVKGLKVAWVHYLAAMLYDITCLSIATGFIYAQSRSQRKHT